MQKLNPSHSYLVSDLDLHSGLSDVKALTLHRMASLLPPSWTPRLGVSASAFVEVWEVLPFTCAHTATQQDVTCGQRCGKREASKDLTYGPTTPCLIDLEKILTQTGWRLKCVLHTGSLLESSDIKKTENLYKMSNAMKKRSNKNFM